MRSASLRISLLMALFTSALSTPGLVIAAHATEAGMTVLSESELATVSGQEGVLLNLNFRNNVDASNTPIGCTPVVNTPNPCRLGLEFAARAGKWLMLKEYYGTFQIKNLRMDGTVLPASSTAYANSSRFQDRSGACLITLCDPRGLHAIKFSFPGTDAAATYDDFLSFLNIGRVWLEFDTAVEPAGIRGFDRDTTLNSALGVRMSDSTSLNAPAKMRFRGTGYVYGF